MKKNDVLGIAVLWAVVLVMVGAGTGCLTARPPIDYDLDDDDDDDDDDTGLEGGTVIVTNALDGYDILLIEAAECLTEDWTVLFDGVLAVGASVSYENWPFGCWSLYAEDSAGWWAEEPGTVIEGGNTYLWTITEADMHEP